MNKPYIIIIGASGHAKVVIDVIEKNNLYAIHGLVDSYLPKGTTVLGYKVLGDESIIPDLMESKQIIGGIIAIGDNYNRHKMANIVQERCPSFQFIIAIHPSAILGKNVIIKKGTVVVAGVIINSDSTIEDHCIINTKASVGHDCHIKAFSSVASGAVLGGGVIIENEVAICLGAIVLGKVTIGAHSVIGSGALVNKNIPPNTVAYGLPAKAVRKRKPNDPYL